MELEPYGAAARGLRQYIWLIAEALGVGPGCCYIQLESPIQAYLPLDDRLPGSDVALTWDATAGWAVCVENGADLIPLTTYGPDPVPDPSDVVTFVTRFLAGSPSPGSGASPPAGDVADRLAAYATRFHQPITRAYQHHDRTTGDRGA